jgi:hypothetical protein
MNLMTLKKICSSINNEDLFLYSSLTKNKRRKILENFQLSSDNKVIALVDTSLYKTFTHGLIISEKGLYWKNYWLNPAKRYSLDWGTFMQSKVQLKDHYIIEMASNMNFDAFGCRNFTPQLVHLLQTIQQPNFLNNAADISSPKPEVPQFVQTAIRKQLNILEVRSTDALYNDVLNIIGAPYELSRNPFEEEEEYYDECIKKLLLQIEDLIRKSPTNSEVLLKATAFTIEDLSDKDVLWENIQQKMNLIQTNLL